MKTEITLSLNQWALAAGIFLAFIYYAERLIAAAKARSAASKTESRGLTVNIPEKPLLVGVAAVCCLMLVGAAFGSRRQSHAGERRKKKP